MLFDILIDRASLPELEQIERSQKRNCANLHVHGDGVSRPRRSRQRRSKHSDAEIEGGRKTLANLGDEMIAVW